METRADFGADFGADPDANSDAGKRLTFEQKLERMEEIQSSIQRGCELQRLCDLVLEGQRLQGECERELAEVVQVVSRISPSKAHTATTDAPASAS